jgi:uncharacterized protein (TIGR03663 family)
MGKKNKVQSPKSKIQNYSEDVILDNRTTETRISETEHNSHHSEPETQNSTLFLIGSFAITAVAVFLRFWDLTLKPLHHDEGVNGFFLKTLFTEGVYRYDPTNYHGPTLYFIALAFSKVFGLETVSIRASVAVFGVGIVVLALFLRKYLGSIGSLTAALFLALSPGMVYISRYFIHEIFFVFCSFGVVLGILFFIEGRPAGLVASGLMTALLLVCFLPSSINLANAIAGNDATTVWIMRVGFFAVEAVLVFLLMRLILNWNEGRPIYLMLAAASAALFFATKETAFITLGTLLISCLCVWIWRRISNKKFGLNDAEWSEPVEITWQTFRRRLGEENDLLFLLLAVFAVFAYVFCLFFSSFFTYPEGIQKAFETYGFWTKTGKGDHTQNGYLGYARWMMKIEAPILFLSAVGTLIALFKGRHRFALLSAFWAYGLFAAYTIIPYKTPWLALSFILPMCLIAGYGINELFVSKDSVLKILAGVLTVAAAGVLGYQTYDLNFRRYDDDKMPYVYAHTQRGFLDLVKKIEYYAAKSSQGKNSTIEIVSPDHWSLPWYMRDYPNVHYPNKIVPVTSAEMIVAKKGETDAGGQDEAIQREYASHYRYAGTYPLRPGVELYLLVRQDLADADTREIYQIEGITPLGGVENDSANEIKTVR